MLAYIGPESPSTVVKIQSNWGNDVYEAAVRGREIRSMGRNTSSLFTAWGQCASSWRFSGIQCHRLRSLCTKTSLSHLCWSSLPAHHIDICFILLPKRLPRVWVCDMEKTLDHSSSADHSRWSWKGQNGLCGNAVGHKSKCFWGGVNSCIRQRRMYHCYL